VKTILAKTGHKLGHHRAFHAALAIGGLISMVLAAGAGGKFG